MIKRYKIKIEYDGTPFVGWQFQKNGQSVQEVLQKAIFNFSKENVTVTFSFENLKIAFCKTSCIDCPFF